MHDEFTTTDRATFREHAVGDRPAVVHVAADLDVATTPLAAYAALTGRTTDATGNDYAFLLESGEKTEGSDPDGAFRPGTTVDRHARFSFVGYDPRAVVIVDPGETTVEALDESFDADLLRGAAADGGDAFDRLRAAMPDVRLAGFPGRDANAGGDAVGDRESRQHLEGGLVGFVSYDAVYDTWLDEVGIDRPESRFPDAEFVLTTRTLAFDHAAGTVSLVFTPVVGQDDDAGAVYDDLVAERDSVADLLSGADDPDPGGAVVDRETAGPREDYEAAVRRAKRHVEDGDIYQGVVSRKRELYGDVDALGLYAALRDVNPSPYMYLLAHDGLSIVGASPETLVSVSGDRVVANPIAGTCPRGKSPVEDRRLAGEMLADGKERAEHTMLVDLARNDVRRVADPGSVRVEEFMAVLKYSHVQHIESTVVGTLASEPDDAARRARRSGTVDAFDATRATFPAGTLSGAPKVRAMEIIDDLERTPRGPYGGGVGYYSWDGDADVAIVIRSATVEDLDATSDGGARGAGDRVTVQAGAGIVADSDPGAEFEETESKMDGVLAALDRIRRPRERTEAPR
ncbi:MAG: anthranilate synthase component I [Halobacteriales archaeon]